MARSFSSASTQWIKGSSAPVTAVPLSIAAWFNPDASDSTGSICDIAYDGGTGDAFEIGCSVGSPGYVYALTRATNSVSATSTSTFTASAWNHVLGTFNSDTNNRAVYLNGGSKGTNSSIRVPASLNAIGHGARARLTTDYYIDAILAEIAIWNVELTDDDAVLLAKGISPILLKPANLVYYLPLIRDPKDLIGATAYTVYNSPAFAVHPKVRNVSILPRFEFAGISLWPFTEQFTGSNGDPWSASRWTPSIG